MAYGRYDRGRETREPRNMRSGWDDDRSQRFSGDRDERGWFERAGEEISSWFGDDDRGRRPDEDRSRYDRNPRFQDEGYRRPYTGRSGSRPESGGGYQPMAGDYGRFGSSYGERFGPERAFHEDRFDRGSSQREGQRDFTGGASGIHDPHYADWRRQQIDALDRDYDEYRRENRSRFESDFANWRTTRQSKREMLGSIREQMQVVGSDEQPLGTVDKVRGDRVILTKDDSPDGQHHTIGCGMIDRVEGDRVILDKTAEEAKASWGSEERDRALFERDENREPGAHILNRSFSGTY